MRRLAGRGGGESVEVGVPEVQRSRSSSINRNTSLRSVHFLTLAKILVYGHIVFLGSLLFRI